MNFFCRNKGPTLELLSFFSQYQARSLLKRLSKKTTQFYHKNRHDVNRLCLSVLQGVEVSSKTDFNSGVRTENIVKVIHLKDEKFLICYRDFTIELVDINHLQSAGEEYSPISQIEIEIDDVMRGEMLVADAAYHGDKIWAVAATFNRPYFVIEVGT